MAKAVKNLTEADKVVKRREALDVNELFNAYMEVYKQGGHIGDLAKKLDRPVLSVGQRLTILRKQVKAQGKQLPQLARRPKTGGGRQASTIDPSLLGNLSALD